MSDSVQSFRPLMVLLPEKVPGVRTLHELRQALAAEGTLLMLAEQAWPEVRETWGRSLGVVKLKISSRWMSRC